MAALCAFLIAGANAFPKAAAPGPFDLTPAQRAKLADLDKKGHSELRAVQLSLASKEQKMARIKAIVQKYDAAEMAVLTPAQQQKAKAVRAERLKRLQQVLAFQKTITPAQRAKANTIQIGFRQRARGIVQNKKLTDPQKRAKLIALRKDMERALAAILTPQQRAGMHVK
jgi:N-methylhydantoinase B/oxoprolinase/acetone carboxylase alpha subunit